MSTAIDLDYAEIPGGVCAPGGFRAGAIHCGVIADPKERADLSMICAEGPCTAAGVFTTNKVKAAPVQLDMRHLEAVEQHRAIVANSRNANACTGAPGLEHARQMAAEAAEALGLGRAEEVFVCSTGHIGHELPIEKIVAGIRALAPGLEIPRRAARALPSGS